MNKTFTKLTAAGTCFLAVCASANVITFETPSGSTTSGGAVDAKAIFTTGAGTLTITLENLEADPNDVAQCVSALGFGLTTGQTTASTYSGSAKERTVNGNKTFTDGGVVSAGWILGTSGGGLKLDDLAGSGHAGPAHLLIGGPAGDNKYDNSNGSIKGNGPHNPFLAGDLTFTLNIAGLTSASSINNVWFQFGTTEGQDIVRIPPPPSVPDGGTTVALLGTALTGLAMLRRKLS